MRGLRAAHRQGTAPGLPARHAVRDLQAARGTTLTGSRTGVRLLALGIGVVGLALDQLDAFALRTQRAITIPLLKTMLETE